MLTDIVFLFLITSLLFIPLVIWGYLYTSLSSSVFSRKVFLIGIIAGGVSVFPILFQDTILGIFFSEYSLFQIIYSPSYVSYLFSFFILFGGITFFTCVGFFYERSYKKIYRNIGILSTFLIFIFIMILGLQSMAWNVLDENVTSNVMVDGYILNTMKYIIIYYMLVVFIEEVMKYISFSYGEKKYIHPSPGLYVVFIALGFAFIENILYVFSLYQSGVGNGEILQIGFFRSIFSLTIHVFSSVLIYIGFSKIEMYGWKKLHFVFLFILAGYMVHASYNIGLAFGFTMIAFIYFVLGYFYLSGFFYNQKSFKKELG